MIMSNIHLCLVVSKFEFLYHAIPLLNTAVQHVSMCDSGSTASSTVNTNTMFVK